VIFNEIAQDVVETTPLACEFAIPDPPEPLVIDPDTIQVIVAIAGVATVLHQVTDLAACEADAFYVENETVILCPQACAQVQATPDARGRDRIATMVSHGDDFQPFQGRSEAGASEFFDLLQTFVIFASGDRARARRAMALLHVSESWTSPFMIEDSLSLLHVAARFDLREATATLLGWGVPVDTLAWPHHDVGDLWRRLGEDLPIDLVGEARRGGFGLSPLHLAVLADHEPMVRYLLGRGANPRRRVGLDGGVEGMWSWTTVALAKAVRRRGTHSSVMELVQAAVQSATEPRENHWIGGR